MAKKNMTRAQALECAIAMFEEGSEPRIVLEKMLAQITKPRKATVSKARLMNENLAAKVVGRFPANGDFITTKDVVAMGIPGIATPQKATAVLKVAGELNLIEQRYDLKHKKAVYCVNKAVVDYLDAKEDDVED